MGPEHPYGAVPGQIPAQVSATDHREAAKEEGVGGMGLSYVGGSN